jgi:hypothetical protein
MIRKQSTLTQLQQALRTEVCSTCPFRAKRVGPGLQRSCESKCSLFIHLPTLKDRAERLEPMVGRHEETLLHLMQERMEADEGRKDAPIPASRNALRLHQHKVAKLLARMINV